MPDEKPTLLPWNERVTMFQVNPLAATPADIMRMAEELSERRPLPAPDRGGTPELDAVEQKWRHDPLNSGYGQDLYTLAFSLERRLRAALSLPAPLQDEVEGAIDAEPELPGEIPDEMWEAIKNDRDACTEAMRIVVRQTKEGIKNRLASHLRSKQGEKP